MTSVFEKFQTYLKTVRINSSENVEDTPAEISFNVTGDDHQIVGVIKNPNDKKWSQIRDKVNNYKDFNGAESMDMNALFQKIKKWLEDPPAPQSKTKASHPEPVPKKLRALPATGAPSERGPLIEEAGDDEEATQIATWQPNVMAQFGAKFMIESGLNEDQLVSIVKKCGLEEMLTDKLANTVLNLNKVLVHGDPANLMKDTVTKFGLQPALADKILEKYEVSQLVSKCYLKGELVDKIVEKHDVEQLVSKCDLKKKLVDEIVEENEVSQLVSKCDLKKELVDEIVEDNEVKELVSDCDLGEQLVDKIYEKSDLKQLVSDCDLKQELVDKIYNDADDDDDDDKAATLVNECELKDELVDKIMSDNSLSDIVSQCGLKTDLSKKIKEAVEQIHKAACNESGLSEVVSKFKLEKPLTNLVFNSLTNLDIKKGTLAEIVSTCQLGAPLVDQIFARGLAKPELLSSLVATDESKDRIATKIIETADTPEIVGKFKLKNSLAIKILRKSLETDDMATIVSKYDLKKELASEVEKKDDADKRLREKE